MSYPRSVKRLHAISIWFSAGPALFLAVLLIGSGLFFFAVGNDAWNETVLDVREVAGKGHILYSNLQYAKDRLLIGTIAFFVGIILFSLTVYVILQRQKMNILVHEKDERSLTNL